MPLLYVAIPLSSVQWSGNSPDFSALRCHPAHPGKALVLGNILSLKESEANPWGLRTKVFEKYQNEAKYFSAPFTSHIENYAIYCLDIPNEGYYQQLRATPELFLDTSKFTVVGYFRAAAKNHDLQVVLNTSSQEVSRDAFLKKLKETNKKVSLPSPRLESFPAIEAINSPRAVVAKQTPAVVKENPDKLPADSVLTLVSQVPSTAVHATSPVVISPRKPAAIESDGILYVAVPFSTLEATGYYGNPSSLLESPDKPGKVRMIGDISSLAYPNASLEDLRKKAIERFRQDTNTASICDFLPSPIIFALRISDKIYLQALKPTAELFLETDKFTIVGFYMLNETRVVAVLNTDDFSSDGLKATNNFKLKLKQAGEQLARQDQIKPVLMSCNIVKAKDVVVEEVSVAKNSATMRLELTASQELLLNNNNNENSFLQAKYLVPLLLLLGGLALCTVGGGILMSLLLYSFLTTTLIVVGISIMTGGTFLLSAGAAAATYYALSEEPAEPVITAVSTSDKVHPSPTSAGSALGNNSAKRRSVKFRAGTEATLGADSPSGSVILPADVVRPDTPTLGYTAN